MKILIVESPYYTDVAVHLLNGTTTALKDVGASFDVMTVPGALEIPAAIKMHEGRYDGYIALGCVIRGETSHYDIVAGESARGLMDLSVEYGFLIGNGILTCETLDQALVRADPAQKNKGADVAEAVIALVNLKKGICHG